MDSQAILASARHLLAPRQLTYLEEVILTQTVEGRLYREIALDVGYELSYVRDVGSKLWNTLSKAMGSNVTKKNVVAILKRHEDAQPTAVNSVKAGAVSRSSHRLNTLQINTSVADAIRFPGRSLDAQSDTYIERPPVEELIYRSVLEPGSLTRVQAARQMGKTSLIHRLFGQLRGENAAAMHLVYLNLRQVDQPILADLDKFLRWFCWTLSQKVGIPPQLNQAWIPEVGAKVNCSNYLQNIVLKQVDRPLIIAFDDLSRLLLHPSVAQDILPMFRTWHEEAIVNADWGKLRLILLHNAEVNLPLPLSQSPFNVGLDIRLPDLTREQARELGDRCGISGLMSQQKIDQLYGLLGGHPYLLQVAFHWIAIRQMPFDELVRQAPSLNGIFRQHLRYYWLILQDRPLEQQAFRQVVSDERGTGVELSVSAACWLEELGLVKLVDDLATVSRPLYRIFFAAQQVLMDNKCEPSKGRDLMLERAISNEF